MRENLQETTRQNQESQRRQDKAQSDLNPKQDSSDASCFGLVLLVVDEDLGVVNLVEVQIRVRARSPECSFCEAEGT